MVRRNRASRKRRAGVKAGRTYKNLVGTRAEVMHGSAFKTSYGKTKSERGDALTKKDLKYNNHGRIISSFDIACLGDEWVGNLVLAVFYNPFEF